MLVGNKVPTPQLHKSCGTFNLHCLGYTANLIKCGQVLKDSFLVVYPFFFLNLLSLFCNSTEASFLWYDHLSFLFFWFRLASSSSLAHMSPSPWHNYSLNHQALRTVRFRSASNNLRNKASGLLTTETEFQSN